VDYKILWCLREWRVRISNTHGCLKTTHTSLWPLYYGVWGSLKIITYILIKDWRMERHWVILFFIFVWPLGMSTERFFYAGNSAPQPVLSYWYCSAKLMVLIINHLYMPNNIHNVRRSAAQTGFFAAVAGMMCRTTFTIRIRLITGKILSQNFNKYYLEYKSIRLIFVLLNY
jgi:hypothetical protein